MLVSLKVTGSIVTYNQSELAAETVRSVLNATKGVDFSLFVIDNGSSDGTADRIERIGGATVLRQNANLGFGKAHNRVLDRIRSAYHVVINPEIRLDADVISELVAYLEKNPDVAMVTPKICNADGTEQHLPMRTPKLRYLLGGRLAKLGRPFSSWRAEYTYADHPQDKPFEIDFCTGCFFVIRTDIFQKLGGFDERFFMYFEDADLTRRAKQFGKVIFYPMANVTHFWERSSAHSLHYFMIHLRSMFQYFRKWRNQPE